MRTPHLAAIAFGFLAPAAPVVAQDASGAVAQQFHDQRNMQQQSLHDDARDYRDLSGAALVKLINDYRKETEPHRQNALQIAEQARTNPLPAGTGARIRDALEADLTLWHNSLPVERRDWDAMRKQWLVPVSNLTDQQWAQQRAAWFTARDAWLDKRTESAQLIRH